MNRFEQLDPCEALKPYVKYFVISENEHSASYKVLPGTSLVMGFQYKGHLSLESGNKAGSLSGYGITGLQDEYRIFKSSDHTGSVLVYFNETGASHFFRNPVNELFSESLSLDNFVCQSHLNRTHEQLCEAHSDIQRIVIVENFLLYLLKHSDADQLVRNALRLIYVAKGNIRVKQLAEELNISQSPLEKRFRSIVGATPKKFASIVRFQSIANELSAADSLTNAAFEAGYYDQAHFIKDFKQYSGDTPQNFRAKEK
jgi:AraC-like DNA-binding protein